MRTAVSILRWILWCEAAVLLSGAATLATQPELSYPERSDGLRWIVLAELILGTLMLLAALSMQMRFRWAVAAGLAVSVLNVMLIVMAPLGIYGLILLCQKAGRNQLGPKPPPLPGAEPPHRVHQAINIALLAATLAACYPMFRYLEVNQVPITPLPLLIVGLWVEIWVVVLVHELGHWFGGWVCGFELVQLAVGRTMLVRQDERWQLKRVKKLGAGGLAGIRPRTADHLREKYALFVAAGPLASLLFAVLLFGLFLISPGRPWQILSPVIGITAAVSFQVFVGNSLPIGRTRYLGDGTRFRQVCRLTAEGERLLARIHMLLTFTTPLRPRDLPADWIRLGVSMSDDSKDHMSGCVRAYESFLDRGEIEAAGRWLDEWLRIQRAGPIGTSQDHGLTEAAYFEACHRGNAATARELLNGARRQLMVERYSNLRAWAAVMLAEGQYDAALDLIAQARADLDRRAVTGHRMFERDLLADLERSATSNVLELPCATVPV